MKKLKVGEKYEIEWRDTFSKNGWHKVEEIQEWAKRGADFISSVGYFVGEYGEFMVFSGMLATDILTEHTIGLIQYIPKGCIKKCYKLSG